MTFQEILKKKIDYYGKTEAAYEFAANEYAAMIIDKSLKKGQTLPLDSVRLRYFKAKYYARHLERDVTIIIKGRDFVEAKCEYLMKSDIDDLTFVSEITE